MPGRVCMMMTSIVLMTGMLPVATDVSWGVSWPMFHGDRRHSGFSVADAPFDSFLAWTYPSSDSIFYSSPVVADDGTIYIGNLDKELLALSPVGDLLWRFRADGNFRHSTPAIAADGTIYIGGSNGQLYAVNPDSTLKWTFTAGAPIKTSPNIGADGTVYFGADDGKLYAVNPDSTIKWTFQAGDSIRSSPAIGPDGTIFFGSHDHFLYAVWPTGTQRWRAATGDIIKYCSPAVSATGVVYFGSYDGFLYAVTSDQVFQWAYYTGHTIRSSPAIGPTGIIYVGAGTDLLAITPDGDLEWDYGTGGDVISSPAYFGDDDVIGVGSDDGVFYCIHSDGTRDWTYTLGHPIRSSPAPSALGDIYIADLSGQVWALGRSMISVEEGVHALPEVRLLAIPNPSSSSVVFRLLRGGFSQSRLLVFDAVGRQTASLAGDGAGRIVWDGRDQRGRPVSSGVYFYRLDGSSEAGRVMLVR